MTASGRRAKSSEDAAAYILLSRAQTAPPSFAGDDVFFVFLFMAKNMSTLKLPFSVRRRLRREDKGERRRLVIVSIYLSRPLINIDVEKKCLTLFILLSLDHLSSYSRVCCALRRCKSPAGARTNTTCMSRKKMSWRVAAVPLRPRRDDVTSLRATTVSHPPNNVFHRPSPPI